MGRKYDQTKRDKSTEIVLKRTELPENSNQIYNTFQVPQLRKCEAEETALVPYWDNQANYYLNFIERPVAILDRKVRTLRNKRTT